MSLWYRKGDYYQLLTYKRNAGSPQGESPAYMRRVNFSNTRSPIIRELEIRESSKGEVGMTVISTSFYFKQLNSATKHLIPAEAMKYPTMSFSLDLFVYDHLDITIASGNSLTIVFNHATLSQGLLEKCVALLSHLNQACGHPVFTDELVREIKQAIEFSFFRDCQKRYQHFMSACTPSYTHTHPERKGSQQLIPLLAKTDPLAKSDFQKVLALLAEGENPYQVEAKGLSATSLAVVRRKSPQLTAAMMFYGVDVMNRCEDIVRISPYEVAMQLYLKAPSPTLLAILNIMNAQLTRMEKSIEKATKAVKVASYTIESDDEKVKTTFYFENGNKIHTHLKHISNTTDEEKNSVLEITKDTFEKITQYFKRNILLDLIYDGVKLIGFIITELFETDKDKDLDVHVVYAYIQPEYRGNNLMKFLQFRLAYSIQTINVDNVKVDFNSIDPGSLGQIHTFLYEPRHQPREMEYRKKKTLCKIFDGDYHYVQQGSICYVLDEEQVKGGGFCRSNTDLIKDFAYRYLLGDPVSSTQDGYTRAVPVSYYVGDENTFKQHECCRYLGINFIDHVLRLANAARPHLVKYVGLKTHGAPDFGRLMKRTDLLFWGCKASQEDVNYSQAYSLVPRL